MLHMLCGDFKESYCICPLLVLTLKADQSYTKKILKGLVLILFDIKMILDGDIKDVMLNLILCHRHNCIP